MSLHMLTDVETWQRLVSIGILDWIKEKKDNGQIKQIGFSYHGNADMFIKLVDAYEWDFAQIQYNYLDEHSQAGRRGLHHAHNKGLAVIIMEPLRGGRLVNKLPAGAYEAMNKHMPHYSPASWAFKWLYNQKEVTCVLSGMNSMEMLEENIKTVSSSHIDELTNDDFKMLENVVKEINKNIKVGCTGCGYCMPCVKGVDIPGCFAAYNRKYSESAFWGFADYVICTALRKNPSSASNCIECGKCEKHCPQAIEIRKELKKVQKEMETPLYKLVRKVTSYVKF